MAEVMLPSGFVYVEVRGGLGQWCIAEAGADKTLCRARVYQVPQGDAQPSDGKALEDGLHADCLRVLAGLGRPKRGRKVRCPACGGPAEVVDGRIGPHADQGRGCIGVNVKVGRSSPGRASR